jgi:hypothetical protein
VSNLEFASELVKRSISILGDESKAHAVLDEFESLDPREAQIVYRAFSAEPGSVEHIHTKTRINALVASGKISSDLGSLANMEETAAPAATPSEDLDYMYSRMAAYAELSLPHNEILDPIGKIAHMIQRGDSKDRIIQEISKGTLYQSRKELAENPAEGDDFAAQMAAFQFNELNEALNSMLDPAEAPDTIAIAKEAIAPYDEDGSIARLIDSGADAETVLQALDFSENWLEAMDDFNTKDDVENPRLAQEETWNTIRATLNAIKDLNDL